MPQELTDNSRLGDPQLNDARLADKKLAAKLFGMTERGASALLKREKVPVIRLSSRCIRWRVTDLLALIESKRGVQHE